MDVQTLLQQPEPRPSGRSRATISPSRMMSRPRTNVGRSATSSGYDVAIGRWLRLNSCSSPRLATAIVRAPSHFSSNANPAPAAGGLPSVASIGATGTGNLAFSAMREV